MQVRLRRFSPDDAPAIAALLGDDYDGVMQTSRMPWPYTESDASAFVEHVVSGAEEAWAVEEVASGVLAGGIGVMPGVDLEIGYWIGRPFRGRGYAAEAVGLVLEYLRGTGVHRVIAHVFVENAASARVLEKSGFVRAGEVEREMPTRGGVRRLWLYALQV